MLLLSAGLMARLRDQVEAITAGRGVLDLDDPVWAEVLAEILAAQDDPAALAVPPAAAVASTDPDGITTALIDTDAGVRLWRAVRRRHDAQSETVRAAKEGDRVVKGLIGAASGLVTLDGRTIAVYGSRKGRRVDAERLAADAGVDLADYTEVTMIPTLLIARAL